MWNLKNNTNELIYKTETDSQTQETNMVTKGKGWPKLEYVINRCTLPNIKQINNKDLLYSTGSCTQYHIINYNGKESEKKNLMHICITELLAALTQYCKSTIIQFFKNLFTMFFSGFMYCPITQIS